MIVGTAGHVDHGKSALVAAMTGGRVDRLAEERARGITIALGFIPFPLPDGRVAGIVDVPGHEELIRTMVAGVSGMDVVLLVVAADDGIMPQTEEHLLILEQLGVRHGVLALSKADRVSGGQLASAMKLVASRVATSSVRFLSPIPVSIPENRGVDEVRRALIDLLQRTPSRLTDDLFRLPVDRTFAVPGTGTVVTGSAWSGAVSVGDDVLILPGDRRGKVRSIEEFGVRRLTSTPGIRTAIALTAVSVADVPRGSVVVHAGAGWEVTSRLDVRVCLALGAAAIERRTRVQVLHATTQMPGWLSPRETIAPGSMGGATLVLDRPLAARGGDRFVLRRASPAETIGGGEVLDPLPVARMPWSDGLLSDDASIRIRALVARRRDGVPHAQLSQLSGLAPAAATGLAVTDADLLHTASRLVAQPHVARAAEKLCGVVLAWHRDHPADPGISLETLRRSGRESPIVTEAALEWLEHNGSLERMAGIVRAGGFHADALDGDDALERVIALIEAASCAPPDVPELAMALGRAPHEIEAMLRVAERAGRVVAVTRSRFYARSALNEFSAALHNVGATAPIRVGAVRDETGLSRKYLIPLLEWADREGVTMRDGDVRHLRPIPRRDERRQAGAPA